jgi:cytochrome c biogenesis protein CcmG, thiol:disulfide interchange protein DsbE
MADFQGTPVVVNFWASWCPPCVAEMPDLETVHQEFADEVAFLGINTQDSPDAAAELVEQTGVTYDLARDPDGALFRAFRGIGMPTTLFVSAEGEIVERHTGILTLEQARAFVEDGLAR